MIEVKGRRKLGAAWEVRAQATVEMAVVAPVLLVLALVTYNLMQFVNATARFDRVAPDIVVAHGVAFLGGEGDAISSQQDVESAIQRQLAQAMDGCGVDIEVRVIEGGESDSDGLLGMMGALRTYRCSMIYTPWPGSWSIAGIALDAPFALTHVREVTVDPWRSGVIA